jgi:hypothetical protein
MESVRMKGASARALLLIARSTGREWDGITVPSHWRSSSGNTWQGARGGPAGAPIWLVAPNDHFNLVTVGALLDFKILLPKLIFHKSFIIF